jgi:hypothetical protein
MTQPLLFGVACVFYDTTALKRYEYALNLSTVLSVKSDVERIDALTIRERWDGMDGV